MNVKDYGMNVKNKNVKPGKKLIVWGYICVFFALTSLLMLITGQLDSEHTVATNLLTIFLIGGTGALLLYFGYKKKNTLLLHKKIEKIVLYQNETNCVTIANAVGVSHNKVIIALKEMIECGYFPNAYIDENSKVFVLPRQAHQEVNTAKENSLLKCPNCGGTTTVIKGSISECEWCGSLLK